MSEYDIFNSMDVMYRSPTGAVPDGSKVHFLIVLPRSFGCKSAKLVIRDNIELSMFWCGMRGDDHEAWECDYVFSNVGVFYYDFLIENSFCKKRIVRGILSRGKVCDNDGEMFQATVYKKGFKTPNWLPGGIMYQIFPDRFFSSGVKKSGVPKDRTIREDWGGVPNYKPDVNGVVTNSDYFGGDLIGIEKKLAYLKSLGVTCIYLNPIFEAHSNHRYNTANYMKVDPLLGTNDDFVNLCKEAEKFGMKIILDGVFSHTGDDSVYFNKKNRYDILGAYNSRNSDYYSWFEFNNWPNDYKSWWGFNTLPEVNELNESYNKYITSEEGVVPYWIKKGASGWRLDVADELPDSFIKNIRVSAKNADSEAIVLGEVWEDASNKESYFVKREYLLGDELDSVMNYPFREAILNFLKGRSGVDTLDDILRILEHYPSQVVNVLMNVLGTHDTIRAITYLAGEIVADSDRDRQATVRLTPEQKQKGQQLMMLASFMQYTLPGVPCIYYGDEVGVEGYKDPFSRMCYPWGNEDKVLLSWYRLLGDVRSENRVFECGRFIPVYANDHFIAYERTSGSDRVLCAVNASSTVNNIPVPKCYQNAKIILGTGTSNGYVNVQPYDVLLMKV